MTGPRVPPLERADVVTKIINLRKGSLQLDSLYGDGPGQATAFEVKFRDAMRDPDDRAKMRLGETTFVGDTIDLPADGLADLPRLDDVVNDPRSGLAIADLESLDPVELRETFIKDGNVIKARAVIGDGRNDENLLVAQLHLSFLRLHNAIADSLSGDIADADTRFEAARQRTTMIYQWMVANVYLPKVCMPGVVDAVKAAGAPLYKSFHQRVASQATELPLPMEFSVAAFRFGHSMIRGAYDHNKHFGPRAPENASFEKLFQFTGGGGIGLAR